MADKQDAKALVAALTTGLEKDLGAVSAYAIAVEHGYEGTEEEWIESLKYDHSDEFVTLSEQVKKDAESASNSATQAVQKATEAEASASAASQSATQVEIGNVPKRTATDLIAYGEDAYAQKPIEVRIKGRTVKNLWPAINASQQNDWECMTDETGLMCVTTTAATTTQATFVGLIGLDPGKTYMGIVSTNSKSVQISVRGTIDGSASVFGGVFNTDGIAFTIPANATEIKYCVACKPADSTSVDYKTRVMLVEGGEGAKPGCFTPPASITSVQTGNLVTSGKNLLRSSTFAEFGNRQGVLSFSLPAGTYTLSCHNTEDWWTDNSNGTVWYIHNADDLYVTSINMGSPSVGSRSHAMFTLPYLGDFTLYTYRPGIAEMATDLQLQLELGSTTYEPPHVTKTPLPEVELRGLPDGTTDELVIKADGTCEVERRTYKYTTTGEEAVSYGGGKANFTVPGITQTGFSASRVICDKLASMDNCANATGCSVGVNGIIEFNVLDTITDANTAKAWLATNKPTFVFIKKNMETETLSPITLSQLPAPTFNQYHDSQIPSSTSVEYARDINLVLANLEAMQMAFLGGK